MSSCTLTVLHIKPVLSMEVLSSMSAKPAQTMHVHTVEDPNYTVKTDVLW